MTRPRAFTLLEVMVALAILAMGFSALSEAYGRAALATIDARNVTIATILARGKMLDVEFEMKKDGFGDFDKVIEGDFTTEGHPEYKWIATVVKIEIPVGKLAEAGGGADLMGMLGGGKSSSDTSAASPMGSAAAQSPINMGMMTPILQTASDVIARSVREVTLEVRFPEGGRLNHIKVATHLVDDVKLATELAKIPGMGSLPNIPGLTPPGQTPPGQTPPGQTPPGQTPPVKQPGTNPLIPGGGNPIIGPGGGGKGVFK